MPRRVSQSPPLLNPPLLILILPTIAILTLLIFAFASSNFRPRTRPSFTSSSATNSVRKRWDSLHVFLVLFAIFCGVFARRNDDESSSTSEEGDSSISSHAPASQTIDDSDERQSVHSRWYSQLSEQKYYEEHETTSVGRLKRNSSSYPDLRQESLRETGNDRFRFFDDFEISNHRQSPASPVPGNVRRDSSPIDRREKAIRVDTFKLRSSPPKSATPPPPPPPSASASANRKPKRSYETIPRREVPQPPPPSPPRPPPVAEESKSECRNGRKRSNATKEIKSVLTSLYNSQRKRKKKYQIRNSSPRDEPAYPPPEPEQLSLTRPPPPPPPPPPSLFHSFFRKGSKNKRIHSLAAPPPPPPPPPPPAVPMPRRNERASKPSPPPETSKRRSSSGSSWRPPLPTPARTTTPAEELENFGYQTPMIPIPPPPPPPFKVPGFRFVVRGDYVKVRSASSSRCSSPERDEIEAESTNKVNNPTRSGPVSCPSPDVNAKADTFIAMLRDGWRLEQNNSVKGRVRLGPGPA